MLDFDPFASLDEVTQGLSKSLHKLATSAFSHTMNAPKLVEFYKVVGMMRNIVI